jgi:hypothetical protein
MPDVFDRRVAAPVLAEPLNAPEPFERGPAQLAIETVTGSHGASASPKYSPSAAKENA